MENLSPQSGIPVEEKNQDLKNKFKISSFFRINRILTIFFIVVVWGFIGYVVYNLYFHNEFFNHQDVLDFRPSTDMLKQSSIKKNQGVKIRKFDSEEDFKKYLEEANQEDNYVMSSVDRGMRNMVVAESAVMMKQTAPMMMDVDVVADTNGMVAAMGAGEDEGGAERFSETNTQVLTIDEPDVIKTDGENIYYAQNKYYYYNRSYNHEAEVKIIKAFPPAELEQIGNIDNFGDLFLYEDTLVIFSNQDIYGYDISDVSNPQRIWKMELEDNNYLLEARLYNGEIYLVTRSYINTQNPCPIEFLKAGEETVNISCIDIYYPTIPVETDSTFIVIRIDATSGEVKDKTSFIGSANSSVVYMSEEAMYITYFYNEDSLDFFANFLSEKCSDLVSTDLISKLNNLKTYDISSQAKMTELEVLLGKFYNGLNNDERLTVENEFSNRMSDYHKEHIRELEKTGIVRVGLNDFKVEANGEVPGYPLNQFSLDEYDGYLRIATTVGERTGSFYWIGRGESLNDVYVLDDNLKEKGSVLNLGETERVYSVRFVEDRGYVVTYRETDPFYVLDLSKPSSPELKGELKIPGYSSYLHPVKDDIILGIGRENSKVKLSLFDVSDPADPQEISKYTLDEYWSEAVNNHHAFLLDKKHEVFFIPGGKGAYIFSYNNDKLSLTKALSKTGVERALYIDDYLYIISDEEISVINENDWTEVNNLEFDEIQDSPTEPVLDPVLDGDEEVIIKEMEVFAE